MPDFVAGQTLSASQLQQLGALATYTPNLLGQTTNPTLGTGSAQLGWYFINGRCIDLWFSFRFGTSGVSAGSGIYTISYPPGYPPMAGVPDFAIGSARLIDSSAGAEGLAYISQTSTVMYPTLANNGTFVGAANPWTWAANDVLAGHVTYLVDA